ncbi:MAG: flagellar basal body L-ring protein FlgH [Balneolia bacterium]|nr:flagellar basal body L-ring protein FlgH [Balneolia bacterium]
MKKFLGILVLLLSLQTFQVSAQHSLFRDMKAGNVGDIITIVLAENISGSSTADSRNSSNMQGGASGSMGGNFMPFEPTFGSDVRVNYGSDVRNLATQRQLLQGYFSVEIVEVTASGNLRVQGTRRTVINEETHEISLDALVRSSDIDNRNQVLSYRLANAEISYQQIGGGVRDITKRRGLLRRAVFIGVGVALTTAAVVQQF